MSFALLYTVVISSHNFEISYTNTAQKKQSHFSFIELRRFDLWQKEHYYGSNAQSHALITITVKYLCHWKIFIES